MPTPNDAPFKVQQRDLKARLRASRGPRHTPGPIPQWLGQHTNPGRNVQRKAGAGGRQGKRARMAPLRAARDAARSA